MSQILLVRHAIAEERAASRRAGKHDETRALTPAGRRKMERAARGLRRILPELGALATSPLLRAGQTAAIVLGAGYPGVEPVELDALRPGADPDTLLAWVRAQETAAPLALVGHEPDLSRWAGWMLSGRHRSLLELKKGAACLLAFDGVPGAGDGVLLWSLTPRQLRALGGNA